VSHRQVEQDVPAEKHATTGSYSTSGRIVFSRNSAARPEGVPEVLLKTVLPASRVRTAMKKPCPTRAGFRVGDIPDDP
jgi:hypothetical protein